MQGFMVELLVFTAFYIIGLVVHACHAAHRKHALDKHYQHRHRHKNFVSRHGFGTVMALTGHAMYDALQAYATHLAEYIGHIVK